MTMEEAKRGVDGISGISNVAYDLLATLTAKLEGIAATEEYIQDAEEEGVEEVRAFFQRMQQRDVEDVEQLRSLLVTNLGG
jgi:hypothetical protein